MSKYDPNNELLTSAIFNFHEEKKTHHLQKMISAQIDPYD
jgi:hypothetical protein